MPDITNPQAVKFANEKVRIAADAVDTLYETLKRLQSEYVASTGDTLFPATADPVADGSDSDGRKRITANQCRGMKTLADAIITYLEGGAPTRISQVKSISVNGTARF